MSQLALFTNDVGRLTKCQYMPGWLSESEADNLLENSLALPWLQNQFPMYGKEIPLPRREAIFGDEPYTYSYSKGKVVLTAESWPEWLLDVRAEIEAAADEVFPLVIGNRYDSGKDHIGWHDDGRPELGSNPAIASLSLGDSRRFQVRAKPKGAIQTFELHHGDLIIMPHGFQSTHLHRIKQETRECGTRVNWTFRPWHV